MTVAAMSEREAVDLAHRIAAREFRVRGLSRFPSVDVDDAKQLAAIAAVGALRRHDRDRGVPAAAWVALVVGRRMRRLEAECQRRHIPCEPLDDNLAGGTWDDPCRRLDFACALESVPERDRRAWVMVLCGFTWDEAGRADNVWRRQGTATSYRRRAARARRPPRPVVPSRPKRGPGGGLTDSEWAGTIVGFVARTGRLPEPSDCCTMGLASHRHYRRRFGSWKAALLAGADEFFARWQETA